MTDKKTAKNRHIYTCVKCSFECRKQSDFDKHILTRKHLNTDTDLQKNRQKPPNNLFSCECGKQYQHRQSLFNHKKMCVKPLISQTETNIDLNKMVIQLIEQNQAIILENKEMREILKESIPKMGSSMMNCHNTINQNKFNLNVFLNEKCKDAMNISDFVNSLQLQIQDLENTGEYGFAEGISRIFARGLKELDIYKRPIHCSDLKREIIHVKSENKWEKEGSERTQLKKAIKQIANKNICMIPEWKKANPGCDKYDSRKNDKYIKLVVESMGPTDEKDEEKEFNKIIRFVAKETMIEKDGFGPL